MTRKLHVIAHEAAITDAMLNAYVDGELDAATRAKVDGYLAKHPEAAARVAELVEQNLALHRAFDARYQEPLPEEMAHLASRIQAEMAKRASNPKGSWRSLMRMAAAIALIVAVGGVTLQAYRLGVQHAGEGPLHQQLARMADSLRGTEAPATPEAPSGEAQAIPAVSTDPTSPSGVETEENGKRAPDLSEFGFRLVGARLLTKVEGQAMELVYEAEDSSRVMLFFSPSNRAENTRMTLIHEGPIAALFWHHDGRSYGLVGEVGRDALLAMGALINEGWSGRQISSDDQSGGTSPDGSSDAGTKGESEGQGESGSETKDNGEPVPET